MKKIFIPLLVLMLLTPVFAFAQQASAGCPGGLLGMLCRVTDVMDAILPLLVALAVIYFVWGVVQYFIGDSEEAKTKGKDRIIYGIIGLAVIVSVWGLVYLVQETFGIGSDAAPNAEINSLVVQQNANPGCNQLAGTQDNFQDLLGYGTCLIGNSVIPFIFALAVVLFLWGALKFILNAGEEEKRNQGKQFMLWGIIALAVMISVWGLVNIVTETFDIGDTNFLPQVKPIKPSA